jgi:hypothetical protein
MRTLVPVLDFIKRERALPAEARIAAFGFDEISIGATAVGLNERGAPL